MVFSKDSLPEPPTVVFCYNRRTAGRAGTRPRVPDDVSIVGFDDLFLSSYTHPPLTTIRQPKHEMGSEATKILFGLLNGGPKSRICTGELVIRQSTTPLKRKLTGRPLTADVFPPI